MQEKTKNVLLVVLIVGLVSMTVAYAALTQTLTIKSSAKINNTKWDIEITDFAEVSGQENLNGGTSEATVKEGYTTSGTTISGVEVTFKKPGDVAKFTFNLKNLGDINAKLTSFTLGQVTTNADVTKEVVCGTGTKAEPATAPGSTAMNLAAKTGTIPCEMTLKFSKDGTMPEQGATQPTAVTIPDTVFVYGQD